MILENREELDVADLPSEITQVLELDDEPEAGAAADEEGMPGDHEAAGPGAAAGPGGGAGIGGTALTPRRRAGGTGERRIDLPEAGISLREMQREMVRQALERTGGNQTQAARLLGISRDALRYKMKVFGLG